MKKLTGLLALLLAFTLLFTVMPVPTGSDAISAADARAILRTSVKLESLPLV